MRPGNDILFQRTFAATSAVVVPVLEEMIVEGIQENVFDVAHPRLAAKFIVGPAHGRQAIPGDAMALAATGDTDAATDRLNTRMHADGMTCDRLLGLPPGSISLSNLTEFRRMLAGLAGADNQSAGSDARV